MRALVTGGSGFIGSNLVDRLLAEGVQVKCLVRSRTNLTWLSKKPLTLVPGDFFDPASLATAVADTDVVLHVAGATRAVRRAEYFRGNLATTSNLLQACQEYGPEHQKFLFISSLAAAGPSSGDPLTEDEEPRPVSAYGESKLAAERAVLEFGRTRPCYCHPSPCSLRPPRPGYLTAFQECAPEAACHSRPWQPESEPSARRRSGDRNLAGHALGAGR